MPDHPARTHPSNPQRVARWSLAGTLAIVVSAATAMAMVGGTGSAVAAGTPLRTLAANHGLYFGVALNPSRLSDSNYNSVAATQFSAVTPENAMKWDTIEPSNGTFNFGQGDQVVQFATANGDKVRGHNLVWHSQLPSWVTSLPTNQVQAAMEAHINGEAGHYKGQIYAWDVVNEPFNEDGTPRQDVFFNAFGGTGYIADALRTAHAADPNAKLYLNDFNIEQSGAKQNAMFNLVQSLKQQGVPIDGVGFESHFIVGQVPSNFQSTLSRFTALGVDVAITELDDRMPTPASTANLSQQATDYSNVVKDCLAVSRCVGLTVWGVDDGDSWVPSTFSGQGAADLYDANFNTKPSYTAVQTALGGSGTTTTTTTTTGTTTPTTTSVSAGPCQVTYTKASEWAGGFVANITIANTGTSTISGWQLTFTFPGDQKVSNAWNATVTQSGENVTATNASFDGTLAPGASASMGFQGTWASNDNVPTSFALNGTACN